jgi:hypothetical protein
MDAAKRLIRSRSHDVLVARLAVQSVAFPGGRHGALLRDGAVAFPRERRVVVPQDHLCSTVGGAGIRSSTTKSCTVAQRQAMIRYTVSSHLRIEGARPGDGHMHLEHVGMRGWTRLFHVQQNGRQRTRRSTAVVGGHEGWTRSSGGPSHYQLVGGVSS